MATYYVRKTGSDAAAGTSAGAAWLTIGKALGAAGIVSGDTVYVGAGVYRETISIAMTSATVETKIYGDVTGAFTGDAGEVQITSYITSDTSLPAGTPLLTLAGRDFLTFQDIVFIQGGASIMIDAITTTATDIIFRRCCLVMGNTAGNILIDVRGAANVAFNWTMDSCIFIKGSSAALDITAARPATADFNLNFLVNNCLFVGGSGQCVRGDSTTGGNTFNVGGVTMRNCTNISSGLLMSTVANWSTTLPSNVYNCFSYGGATAVNAQTLGQIVEDYNIFLSAGTPRTNVTAGAHSVSDGSRSPLFYTGHEFYSVGSNLMPFGMPKPGSPLLGFGNQASSPTTDILGAARPSGFVKIDTGTATAGAAKTITNSGKTFGTNALAGTTIKIISGTGSGQTKSIASNTATVITVDGNWKTNPDSTSVYEIYLRATSSTGTATAGSTTTLTDSNAAWGVNMWAGFTLTIDTGTGNGQTLLVVSNTATVLTFATATAPDNTSTYSLFKGASVNVINAGVGCYEGSNSAVQDTGTVRTGSNSWRIPGAGYYDFYLAVSAVSTTATIYARYDSAYSGTLPSIKVLNGGQVGVADATATCVGAANTWEALALTFTPTANGRVVLRIISSSTTPTGNAFFDDWVIT